MTVPPGLDPACLHVCETAADLAEEAAAVRGRMDADKLRHGRTQVYAFAGHRLSVTRAGDRVRLALPDGTFAEAVVPGAKPDAPAFPD